MRIDLDALEVLDCILREGSFAAAATRLHKAQSAVSYQVRKLEDALGLALFDRSQHRARLTDAGQRIWREGRALLDQAERLARTAEELRQGWEGELALVVDGILPQAPIMAALKQMADEGVPTRIQVKVEYRRGVQWRFEQDQAQMMLVKDYRPEASLEATALPAYEAVLCAAREHPLAALAAVSLMDLRQAVELSVHDSAREAGEPRDKRLFGGDRVFFMSDFHNKKAAIAMGLGFGWLPEFLVREELAQGALIVLPFEGGGRYAFTPQLVLRREPAPGRAARRLRDLLVAHLAMPEG
ncbi:MAG: LysR family transcriptional regulator [Gammaproteobacteria bacterium]|nr:LysR family transcriptional regulator [Gammaproteobacteria bacterium]